MESPSERMFSELKPKEKAIIRRLKDKDIKKLKVITEWHDDYLPCVGFKVAGVQMGIWWLDTETAGAFHYPDSPKARKTILEQIKYAIESDDDGEDDTDKENTPVKVKDATQMWLITNRKAGDGYPWGLHYFEDKGKSICGVADHPTTQPNAAYVRHKVCKTCKKIVERLALPE